MLNIATITGCLGFIGQALTRALLKDNWVVYGIDKCTYAANLGVLEEFKGYSRFHFIKEDIVNLQKLPDCDVVFNLAAESDVDTSNINSRQFVLSNVLGVQNLLHLITSNNIIKNDPPLFFQLSTDEVYGSTSNRGYMFTEDATLNPSNPYAATKTSADLLITSWANTYNIPYIIARPSNNYGPNQHPEKLIPLAVKRLMRGKKIKLHNNGDPVRTWTHVSDTVSAILTIYNKGQRNTVYNISSEFEQTNLETITRLIRAYGQESLITIKDVTSYIDFTYSRPGQDMRYAISANKLKELGWHPKYNINTEMRFLVAGYKFGKFIW